MERRSEVLRPDNAREVADCIARLAAHRQSVFITGGGSKTGFGRPVTADAVLDVSALAGIVDYEPSELYITVQAGTTLAQILEVLAPHRQILAFEPPDLPMVFDAGREQTAGGIVACNLAGPRRIRAGAARDHFLGFAAVNGNGEIWQAGAKVVKNVSGYDMAKLQAGAFGTLSVLTEITLRLLPAPEVSGSIAFAGLAADAAVTLMARALNSPFEVSAAAYLPAAAAARAAPAADVPTGALTLLRVEGHAPSVAYRLGEIEALHAGGIRVSEAESERLWHAIGAVQTLLSARQTMLWRICTAPAAAASVYAALRESLAGADGFFDWGGGLIWLEFPADVADAGAAAIRNAIAPHGGHATLVRAQDAVRRLVPVFQPLDEAAARLSLRVKQAFDPSGTLNPGRMTEGS